MSVEDLDVSDQMQECIDNCFEAAEVCESCATSCIAQGNKDLSRCIDLCRDIGTIATAAAVFMSRNSEFNSQICEVCAEVCEACAEECRNHDMEATQACAEVLDQCVDSCREMAQAA